MTVRAHFWTLQVRLPLVSRIVEMLLLRNYAVVRRQKWTNGSGGSAIRADQVDEIEWARALLRAKKELVERYAECLRKRAVLMGFLSEDRLGPQHTCSALQR